MDSCQVSPRPSVLIDIPKELSNSLESQGCLLQADKLVNNSSCNQEPVFCQVSPCPPVLAGIQAQILEELSNTLESAGRRLATEDSGSVLVVVNNSSRLGSDIKRDVAKIGEI